MYIVFVVGVYLEMGIYDVEVKLFYWVWGVVVMFFVCIMFVVLILFFRWLFYEIFLFFYIIMVIFVIIGSWYYVVFRFSVLDGYIMWLWIVCVVWFFDWLLWIVWMVCVGFCYVKVIEIGDGYVCVDISCVWWGSFFG